MKGLCTGAKAQSQDINSLTRDKKVGIAEFEDKMPKLHLFNSSPLRLCVIKNSWLPNTGKILI